jgi:hypothetical protein
MLGIILESPAGPLRLSCHCIRSAGGSDNQTASRSSACITVTVLHDPANGYCATTQSMVTCWGVGRCRAAAATEAAASHCVGPESLRYDGHVFVQTVTRRPMEYDEWSLASESDAVTVTVGRRGRSVTRCHESVVVPGDQPRARLGSLGRYPSRCQSRLMMPGSEAHAGVGAKYCQCPPPVGLRIEFNHNDYLRYHDHATLTLPG